MLALPALEVEHDALTQMAYLMALPVLGVEYDAQTQLALAALHPWWLPLLWRWLPQCELTWLLE